MLLAMVVTKGTLLDAGTIATLLPAAAAASTAGPGASNWGSALNASSCDCACSMSAPAAAVVAAPSSSSSPHAARPTAIATIRSRANHRLNVMSPPVSG